MAGRSNQTVQGNPDSPSHDNIWRGSPSRIESAASWDSMMESLSLRPPTTPKRIPNSASRENMWRGLPSRQASAASWDSMMELLSPGSAHHEEMSPSRDSPPTRRMQHPSVREGTSSGQTPPVQPQWQSPNLREKTLLRQFSSEQPPRPPSKRPEQYGSTQSRTTTSTNNPFLAQNSQPGGITIPSIPPGHPLSDQLAAYIAIYEARPWSTNSSNTIRRSRRNSSIIVQSRPGSNKFREFCCVPAPHRFPKRHLQFYSSPDIPDPRYGSPGLLAMQFIAWVPQRTMAELDGCMVTLRYRVRPEWTHLTWITIYLEDLVNRRVITIDQMQVALRFQHQALDCPYTEDLPNRRRCFPHLGQQGTSHVP